jgi:hypothetical protein
VRRALVVPLAAAILATGCSHSSKPAESSSASAAAPDRRLCAAYDAFWNTPYGGGEPSPAMLARERALIAAAEATPDQALHDAVRAVIDAELGLPKFDLHDTAQEYRREQAQLSPDAQTALATLEQNHRAIKSKCDAVGRPINT